MNLQHLCLRALLLVLPACGDGGGTTTSPLVQPPAIMAQPQPQAVQAGQAASFSVTATGSALGYQWQRDGVDIPAATASAYTLAPTAASDDGVRFRVRVDNPGGTVTSDAALLTVRPAAVAVARPRTLAAGLGYTLAVRGDGQVLVWGAGTGVRSPAVVAGTAVAGSAARVISGLTGIGQVVAAVENLFDDALAVRTDGQVLRWGTGDDLLTYRATPTVQAALGPAVALSRCETGSTRHTLVLREDGWLWLDGTKPVAGIDAVVSVAELGTAAGGGCAPLVVRADGSVWTVRLDAAGAAVDSVTPVAGLPSVVQVSCGGWNFGGLFCLALAADGGVWSWGANAQGQLGNGTTVGSSQPFPVLGLSGARRILAGTAGQSLAITRDGALWTWGTVTGRPAPADNRVPGRVGGWADVVDVAAGFGFTVVRRADGSVWGWGDNAHGQLGDTTPGNTSETPVRAVGVAL